MSPLRCLFLLSLLSLHIGGSTAFTWTSQNHNQFQKGNLVRLQNSLHDGDKTSDLLHDIQQKLDRQQTQIDQLIRVLSARPSLTETSAVPALSSQQSSNMINDPATFSQPTQVTPVKVMLFIDGTWLYYSIFQRESDNCPICQRFGPIWTLTHMVDWQALNRIVSRCLMEELHAASALGMSSPVRPISIVRSSVFTSYKADTATTSNRYKMFEELRQANFDVHMMETVGKSEKCVDIQLAVEMLHFATVPHAYDLAVLLTGDKDFIPAMMRTRQKGRQVALVSMKRWCNQALVKTDMLKDFDVIWLDDHIEELIVPIPVEDLPQDLGTLSIFTVLKLLRDFVGQSDEQVSSRAIGRFLKSVRVGKWTVLEELKTFYEGIIKFLVVHGSNIFSISFRDEDYWLEVKPAADSYLLNMAKRTNFTNAEVEFFQGYDFTTPVDRMKYKSVLGLRQGGEFSSDGASTQNLPTDRDPDYSSMTLSQLREICRESGLPVSGLKAAVLERIRFARQGNDAADESIAMVRRSRFAGTEHSPSVADQVPETVRQHLIGLLKEYIHASGGKASSRDVGRYLAANQPSSISKRAFKKSALQELKSSYGSLASFVSAHPDVLARLDDVDDTDDNKNGYAFFIGLQQGAAARL